MEKQKAIICAYIENKGFGFLSAGTGKEFRKWFFHVKQYNSEGVPQVGTAVTFEVSPISEGPCPTALNIEIAASTPNGGSR